MRLFRLGSLVEQISPATMTGIKTGVGLTVAVSQLPTLLGVSADPEDEGFFGKLADTVSKVGDANGATVALSAVAIATLLVLRRVAPQVPGPLVVSVGAILLVALTDIEERGLVLIGEVPSGLPTPTAPMLGDIGALFPGALAIAVMAFMETVLVARAQRQRAEPPIDSDRELLANGAAALAGGLSQCLPPAGGFSQSAVNQRAGARSQLAGVTTAVLAVLVALFLGPVLEDLPEAILAAMVMVAVIGLISPAEFDRLYRIDRAAFWVAVATAVVGLTAGLLLAVGVGVVLTLVLVLRGVSSNRARPLYVRSGGGWTTNPPEEDGAMTAYDDLLLRHVDGSLYTGNARPTQDSILNAALVADPRPVGRRAGGERRAPRDPAADRHPRGAADRPRGRGHRSRGGRPARRRPRDRAEVAVVREGRGRGPGRPHRRRGDQTGSRTLTSLRWPRCSSQDDQLAVHRVGADEHPGRRGQLDRPDDHRPVLPAAEPAVAADQSLERRHLAELVEQAVHVDVGRLGHRSPPAARSSGRLRSEPRERVLADHHAVAEPVLAGRPEHHRSEVDGVDDGECDPGVGDQARHQRREPVAQLVRA